MRPISRGILIYKLARFYEFSLIFLSFYDFSAISDDFVVHLGFCCHILANFCRFSVTSILFRDCSFSYFLLFFFKMYVIFSGDVFLAQDYLKMSSLNFIALLNLSNLNSAWNEKSAHLFALRAAEAQGQNCNMRHPSCL